MKRLLPFILMIILICFCCGNQAIANITVNLNAANAYVGDSVIASGTADPNTWLVLKVLDSSQSILILDAVKSSSNGIYNINFKVPDVTPGVLNIVMGNGNNVAKTNLSIIIPAPPVYDPTVYPVNQVTIDKSSLNLPAGSSPYPLVANLQPDYASYPSVSWNSSNPEVASVSNGQVTPHTVGRTVIYAIAVINGITASCSVIVTPNPGSLGWLERKCEQKVAADKTWHIKCNLPIAPGSVNKDNIMVLDSANLPVNVTFKPAQDNSKEIMISPPYNGFRAGETYYLYIGSGITSIASRPLLQGIKYEFMIASQI